MPACHCPEYTGEKGFAAAVGILPEAVNSLKNL
jgi:hypothetical protein